MAPHLNLRSLLVVFPVTGLVLGIALHLFGETVWSSWVLIAFTLPSLLTLLIEIHSNLRRGDVGLDFIAALSMTAALLLGEELAAAIVALMYAGGQYLESFAERQARREMTELLSRVPRTAIRHKNGALEEVDLAVIVPGDRILVRQGDTVPVDGAVADGLAVLDQSALTGESMPVQQKTGEMVMSGSTNAGEAFDLVASRRAAESTYAGIVRLVEAAQHSKAPMSRLADRYAVVFLAVTVALAGGTWFWTAEASRAVAVLVVATPCPLILAVPVAMIAGLSRAAKHGILIKGAKALETMARVRALVIDKTGTLTAGSARIISVHAMPGFSGKESLRIAASLDQASKHIIAQAIVSEAHNQSIALSIPGDVVETPGEGIEGSIEGRHVIVGGRRFVRTRLAQSSAMPTQHPKPGAAIVAVAIDGKLAAEIVLSDELRSGTQSLLKNLRNLGIERIVLATGDRRAVAESVAAGLPIDSVRAELTPDQKVMVVLSERKYGVVMMIGDGVNDAPALAAADIGMAMGARGAAASAEAADAVLLIDQLDRVVPAIQIAQRTRRIALESVYVGLGLSVVGMLAAACGAITPVQGALFQELIDVSVILNALRALRIKTAA